ncbi:MAG TPA: hypothetical protein VE131_16765 [Terriglobales bacterium]|nr:hypothetical protein [Terriglobales bacterium]
MLALTILSGLALLALLVVLGWALSQIAHALQGITCALQSIAMGVRAIDRETEPLKQEIAEVNQTFKALEERLDSAGMSLGRIAH